jgi:hypothetical protein
MIDIRDAVLQRDYRVRIGVLEIVDKSFSSRCFFHNRDSCYERHGVVETAVAPLDRVAVTLRGGASNILSRLGFGALAGFFLQLDANLTTARSRNRLGN